MHFGICGHRRPSRPPRSGDADRQPHAVPSATWSESAELVTIVNAQLDRCASEISRRSTTQQTIQAGCVSVTAGLGTAVIGGFTPLVLLLLPIISVSLGSQWLDHHKTIRNIGRYAALELEPALHCVMGSIPHAPTLWESYWHRDHFKQRDRHWWAVPIFTIYYGLPALALVIAFPSALLHPAEAAPPNLPTFSIELWPRILWGFGAMLIAYGTYRATRALFAKEKS